MTNAIDSFRAAISFKSDCIICKTLLAEAYELIGDGLHAINTYKEILSQNRNKDTELLDYLNEQIEIVENMGPRKLPPMTGFRYMSY